ncbi:hypothetical protein EJ08DRAFT_655116 [Tothia fuscella]|uniref:SH3 domain-containing protein n=1 Tax=Tothia fuscella TaxID=1048955 RepID=A0A9P4P488_9PEZI|nr:hypothetical protein EJ08DRAFT_655116 [Tothia fuscella]
MPEPSKLKVGVLPIPIYARAKRPYTKRDILELTLKQNQPMKIIEVKSEWWFIARLQGSGKEGWVPVQYVTLTPQTLSDEEAKKVFDEWKSKVEIAIGEKTGFNQNGGVMKHEPITAATFPNIPIEVMGCEKVACTNRKLEKCQLGACVHEIETLMKGVGEAYCSKWLWRESLMWHPDQFSKKCSKEWRDEGAAAGSEMFIILQDIVDKERAKERVRKGVD